MAANGPAPLTQADVAKYGQRVANVIAANGSQESKIAAFQGLNPTERARFQQVFTPLRDLLIRKKAQQNIVELEERKADLTAQLQRLEQEKIDSRSATAQAIKNSILS